MVPKSGILKTGSHQQVQEVRGIQGPAQGRQYHRTRRRSWDDWCGGGGREEEAYIPAPDMPQPLSTSGPLPNLSQSLAPAPGIPQPTLDHCLIPPRVQQLSQRGLILHLPLDHCLTFPSAPAPGVPQTLSTPGSPASPVQSSAPTTGPGPTISSASTLGPRPATATSVSPPNLYLSPMQDPRS